MKFIGSACCPCLLSVLLSACASGSADPADPNGGPIGPPPPMGVAPTPGGPTQPGTNQPTTGQPTQAPPVNPQTPGVPVEGRFGSPVMGGSGQSTDRWKKADVTRDGKNYYLMANGWGPNFESQSIAWEGTSFVVNELQGEQGENWEPATYPTMFCGIYSDSRSKECGLPAALDSLTSLRTGWSWSPADAGSNEEYNAAYDVWLATGPARSDFSGFFMVWLREPPGQQPAGSLKESGVTVPSVPGVWDIWTGSVNNAPIINYVRAEGQDTLSLEFDILDFIEHAHGAGYEIPGTHVLSVAVGFEIWNGPVTNLASHDFYVDVQ